MTRLSRYFLALLSAVPLAAQTVPELIGVTAATPLLRTRDMGTCAERACPPTGFPPMAAHPAAGGTAFDPGRGGAWISNGTHLACVTKDGCRFLCPTTPLSLAREFVSGLAVDETRRHLLLSTTSNAIEVYELDCPLGRRISRCIAPVPATHTIGGIATADVEDFVIFSSSDFSGTAPPANTLYVAARSAPCTPLCSVPIPRFCGTLGPIHGVAYDQCTRTVWVTDGFATLGMTIDLRTCTISPTHCCAMTPPEPFIGLCVAPSEGTTTGRNCIRPSCPPCAASMTIGTKGSPAIGNADFAITLESAPAGGGAWLLLSFAGPCTGGMPTPTPFCGLLHVDFSFLIVLGGVPITGGPAACGGTATMPVPVPADLGLCGLHACGQWLGICPLGGVFTSNALSFALSGT
ncbi:MAG: hypothetical protein AB7I19_09465 [Planctomycetota bacterium]